MPRPSLPSLPASSVLVAVALLLAGCASEDGGDQTGATGSEAQTTVSEPTTTVATTTTTAAPTPEEEVMTAYLGYWQAIDEAFAPPQAKPDLPALRQYTTGEARGIIDNVEEALAENFVFRIPEDGQYAHDAEVLAVDGTSATVRDCTIDDTVQEVAGTGEVLDDGVSTRLYIAMMVKEDGQWRLAVLNRESTWEGVGGCALET